MLSLRKYMTLSVVAASAVIYHAFATRRQFFPTAVYLSTSKLAVAAVGNLSFAMALAMYNLVIKIFLGTLREIELERVKEKLSSAIMETCLALTIFREEFNIGFVGMFTVLTFVKVFHWLVEDRVDYIEVTPSVSRLAHARIVSFLLVLLGMDVLFLHHTIAATLDQKGHSVQLLFAFEYIILASTAAATLLKYLLSMLDSAMEGRWEGKGTYVFYLELLKDMMHLFVYCIFFVIVFSNYGLPLHLIRDLYMTFRNFKARIADFLRFRQVTARMDRFPDATAQDLARCDGICIICREEMAQAGLNKKLHCGHVFHLHCLRSWLERQQNCPTCRMSVFRPPPAAAPAPAAAAAPGAVGAAPGAAAADAAGAPGAGAGAAGAGPAGAAGLVAPPAAAAAGAPRPPSRSGRSSGGGHRAPGAAAGAAGVPAGAGGVGGAGGAPAAAGAAGGLGGFPAFQPGHGAGAGAGPSSSRRERGGEGSSSRGRDGLRRGGSAAAAAAGEVPAAGIPAGFWAGNGAAAMPAAGLMWQMPQWYPVTSMAAFTNTPLQYAGQQSAVDQAQAQALAAASMVPMVPAIIPAISAPFSAVLSPSVSMGPNATPEQAQAAAAAAMAAAAAAAMYMPPMMPGLALMPPAMLPGGAAPGSAQEQMAAAAAANAAAAAAAAVMGGAATPEVMQASFEATQQMLQRQLDYLQSQMSRIRSSGGADAAAGAAAAGTSGTTPAPAAATDGPGGSDSGTAAAAAGEPSAPTVAAPLVAALQQQSEQPDAPAAAAAAGPSGTPAVEQGTAAAGTSSSGAATQSAGTDADGAGASVKQQQQQQAEEGGAVGEDGAAETAEQLRRRRLQRFGVDEAGQL